jgi:CheY-like chemotaxis protein
MGRKILTEAGYEVVAVSNGAAAVKKIAEQKPDIIILDVYMPGYSGLEVCEKVRGSMETLKTPVLLTVGKMEPYKPEEANRVRADGVIVKPFEASDLLAIVKKFEERIGQASAPTLIKPIPVERFHDNAGPATEMPVEHAEPAVIGSSPQATVEVPDHMATSSAFSDLLGTDAASGDQYNTSAPPAPPARPTAIQAPIPDYDIPVSWRREALPEPEIVSAPPPPPPPPPVPIPVARVATPALAPTPVTREVAAPPETPQTIAAVTPRPRQIPVYEERKTPPAPLEIVPTAVPPAREVAIVREPELQESAAEATRSTVADAVEPGLIPTMQPATAPIDDAILEAADVAPLEDNVLPDFDEDEPVGMGDPETPLGDVVRTREEPVEPIERKVAESDFEARVAAAMAAYNQSASVIQEEPAAQRPPARAIAPPPAIARDGEDYPAAESMAPAPSLESAPVQLAPEPPAAESNYHPPVASAATYPTRTAEPAIVPKPSGAVADITHDEVGKVLESALPEAAAVAGVDPTADHHTIAQAVHRVMERLKPELVEEIVRELKSKKP